MEEPNVDVKKEVILSRLDYAISCVRELEEMDWNNGKGVLNDYQKIITR